MIERANEDIEIELLLEAIFRKYGYDFRNYAFSSIRRRILHALGLSGCENISAMQHLLIHDRNFFDSVFFTLSITTSEMFRDPYFFKAIREQVVPILRTYPSVKIWHAGCSTGEEVYSMAIVLMEEGLLDRTLLYGTDINQRALKKARDGVFPVEDLQKFTANYHAAGGKEPFSKYYQTSDRFALFDGPLKKKMVFADHNLVIDGVFSEVQLVVCRNVLIYFNEELRDQVLQKFASSLCRKGLLCLGSKESLQFTKRAKDFESIVDSERIYRRTY